MRALIVLAAMVLGSGATEAADVRILTTGAMKEVVLALVPAFERESAPRP